jgi:hypothetical protein
MSRNSRMANNKTKHARKANRKHRGRTQRKHRQRQRKQRQGGGACAPLQGADLSYDLAKEIGSTSLKQGEEFQNLTRDFHGGGVLTGADLAAGDSATLPADMRASAGTDVLDQANQAITGLKDGGGRRRKSSRKASRKGRKCSRKQRKSNRKASRKHRKASRKHRKASRKQRKHRQGGGGASCLADHAATFTKDASDGLLLKDYSGAGLHAEWKDVTGAAGGDYLGPKV